jgi:hypothetical protein
LDKKGLTEVSKFRFRNSKTIPHIFSAVSGFGINELMDSFWKTLEENIDETY